MEQNKEKRLEYDREYRERKKEQLKAYRQKYYGEAKEKKIRRREKWKQLIQIQRIK